MSGGAGWANGFSGPGGRGGGRGRFARAFLGLAGALGIDDAPFAGAAAQGGGFELAEGEFDLVPHVADDLVGLGAQGDDIGLLGFELVFRVGLGGELVVVGLEGGGHGGGGHGHGGLAELGDAAGIALDDAVGPQQERGLGIQVRHGLLIDAEFIHGAASGGEITPGDAHLINLDEVADEQAQLVRSGGEGQRAGGLLPGGIRPLGDFLFPLRLESGQRGGGGGADEVSGPGGAGGFLQRSLEGLGARGVGGGQLAEGHGVRWAVDEASVAGAGIRWMGNLPNSWRIL